MKQSLRRIERKLRAYCQWLKWLNDETPLLFLLLIWGIHFAVGFAAMVACYLGLISPDTFNIVLSGLALFAAAILSIVVVL